MTSGSIKREMKAYVRFALENDVELYTIVNIDGALFNIDNRKYPTEIARLGQKIVYKTLTESPEVQEITKIIKETRFTTDGTSHAKRIKDILDSISPDKTERIKSVINLSFDNIPEFKNTEKDCVRNWGIYQNLKQEYNETKERKTEQANKNMKTYFEKTQNSKPFER